MSTGSVDLVEVRYIVQKILMPIIYVIGLIGNSITVLVLTRKPMRCSTNVYLTALAIVDMFYLTMAFLLTLKHYEATHYHPVYWQCIGLIIWLNDGFSYISIYIAVSFTIERYIAVRYPIRRKTYCTEALAKKFICGIVLFCLATTISTAFEYEVQTNTNCKTKDEILSNSNITADDFVGRHIKDTPDTSNILSKDCPKPFYYDVTESIFGSNENYRNIFFIFTMIFFVIIPLIILVTFNTFLVILVRQSKSLRSQMTQKSIRINESIRRPKLSMKLNKNATISQENKITIVLIAVVIVFVICQLPWSIFMIYNQYVNMPIYLSLVLGNIANLLVAINAASNFFLYCVLSDKYRKTVKDLIMGQNKHKRKDTMKLSYKSNDPLCWSSRNKSTISSFNKNSTYNDQTNPTEKLVNSSKNLSLNKDEFLKISKRNSSLLQHSVSLTPYLNQYEKKHQQHLQNHQYSLKHSKYCPLKKVQSKNMHKHKQHSVGLNEYINSWITNQTKFQQNNNYNENVTPYNIENDANIAKSMKRSQSLILLPKTRHSPCCKDYLDDL